MAYELVTVPVSRQALRKLPRSVREDLIHELQALREKPFTGEQLKGEFRFLRSLHVILNSVHYRVVYEVDEQQKAIIVRFAGTRENFYRDLRQLRLKPLASVA